MLAVLLTDVPEHQRVAAEFPVRKVIRTKLVILMSCVSDLRHIEAADEAGNGQTGDLRKRA